MNLVSAPLHEQLVDRNQSGFYLEFLERARAIAPPCTAGMVRGYVSAEAREHWKKAGIMRRGKTGGAVTVERKGWF